MIKVITPKIKQFFFVFLPILIVFGVLTVYIWQIRKYRKKKREFERSEMHIFELDSRETIFKIEHTLRERLTILVNKNEDNDIVPGKNNQTEKIGKG